MSPTRVYDVPMALDQTLSHTLGLEPERAKSRNQANVQDSRKYTLGPMPVDDFIRDFCPVRPGSNEKARLSSRYAFNKVPESAETAAGIYEPLLAALNATTKWKSRCPGFVFESTAPRVQFPRKLGYMKPHICCFAADTVDAVRHAPSSQRTELGYAEFFIDVQASPSHDSFIDPSSDISDSDRPHHDFLARNGDNELKKIRDRALGQHIAYVTEAFARQYRAYMFTVSMCGSHARLLRWDRGGCIVSESFDVRDRPESFCEFLWRYSQMTDIRRGHDLTVEVASPDDENRFRDAITDHVRLQLVLDGVELEKAVSEHYAPGRVAVMHVLAQDSTTSPENIRRFLVSRPVVCPVHLDGRATRGFWGLDLVTLRVVFIKDTWRFYPVTDIEGDVVQDMNLHGVRHIPSFVCHGDIPDFFPEEARKITPKELQMTVTDEYIYDYWVTSIAGKMPRISKQRHYRLVLGTVGYGLKRFKGTEELLHASYDVFHAMRDAHTKASRLHRDISLNNIILVREPGEVIRRGYLIDWDASSRVDEFGEATERGRAGTWHFMSIEMLDLPGEDRKHTLQDDMESLFYVVLYCCVLWLPHKGTKDDITTIFYNFFASMEWLDDSWIGGLGKIANAENRKYTSRFQFKLPALREWLNTVMDYHSPPSGKFTELKDKWSDPDHLDNFWGDFLRTHNLPCDDRVVYDHPRSTGLYKADDDTEPSAGSPAREKRASDGRYASPVGPPAKRTHVNHAISTATIAPRRSRRLMATAVKDNVAPTVPAAPSKAKSKRGSRVSSSQRRSSRLRSS